MVKKPQQPRPSVAEQGPDDARGDADASGRAELEQALAQFFVSQAERAQSSSEALEIHFASSERSLAAVQEYLSFRLADELYAVSIQYIREIIKPTLFTQVPRTAPVVLGVLSLRGAIVPVVDLRLLLGLDALPQTRRSRVLIVIAQEELIGLLVDEVRHVIRLSPEDIEPPPAVFDRSEAEHMIGVGRYDGEMYTLVDLKTMVQLERYILGAQGGTVR